MDVSRLYAAAEAYIGMGWHLFTVTENKTPWSNCGLCAPGICRGRECTHLYCHAYLAATRDLSRVAYMLRERGGRCCLAVATGESGLVVVDAEGDDRSAYGATGVEWLDSVDWFPQTLRARTSGGGVHLYYAGTGGTRNRAFPNVDVKGRGGYVVCPPAAGRQWVNWGTPLAAVPPSAVVSSGGYAGAGVAGTGVPLAAREVGQGRVVPDGQRYEYTRDLVYKLRKNGVSWEDALVVCREAFARFAQPPDARYEMPWAQVEYELVRAWARVSVEVLDPVYDRWLEGLR